VQPRRNYLVHPQYIILTLVIAGVTALFLGFTGSYLYSRVQTGVAPVQLPSLFYFNTLIILASSFTLIMAKRFYLDDETEKFKIALWLTLILSIIFLALQYFAWLQLTDMKIEVNHSTLASYMYLISGLHFIHLVAGIPFLIHFIYVSHKRMKDPVTVLVYFADPDRYRALNILNIYWHFLDGLWVYLVAFFLLNYLF
jgi:cytochrome c oxidase subunit III